MKRILLPMLLTAGLFFLGSGTAFAQRHNGWPAGGLNVPGGEAPAIHNEGPAVRNEAPAVRHEAPDVRHEAPSIANGRPNAHPFYANDRGNENEWRYRYNDNRWWYWTPLGAWAYWNDGRWVDYNQPYTTYYRGATAPTGWYWNDSQHQWYWFDGTTLQASQK